MYISPMRDAIDKGLHPTNHTDFVRGAARPDVHAVVGREPHLARRRGDRRRSARHAAGGPEGDDDLGAPSSTASRTPRARSSRASWPTS